MTDLLQALPEFDVSVFSHILPSLDRQQITLSDLLTLDAVEVARRAHVPPAEVRKLTDVALSQLQQQLGIRQNDPATAQQRLGKSKESIVRQDWETISTLDAALDAALGGGIPVRYLTEIVGESGVGKTQLLLSLLLAVQLPVSHGGLAASAVYISTEAVLSTARLAQIVKFSPKIDLLPTHERPSLSKVLTMQTPDLESQDHILRYQLPVAIKRHGVRLIVIDSIAANFRAEFERKGGGSGPMGFDIAESAHDRTAGGRAMAARRAQLVQLGALLRDLARTENVAIVVANQVADRFQNSHASHPGPNNTNYSRDAVAASSSQPAGQIALSQSRAPSAGSSTAPSAMALPPSQAQHDPLTLDHQQRFFTGWGDLPLPASQLKTPSLGLVWANQLACRIALTRDPGSGSGGWSQAAGMKGQRWMRVVFSAWCGPSAGRGVPFEIWQGGVRSTSEQNAQSQGVEAVDVNSTRVKRLRTGSPDGRRSEYDRAAND